MMLDTGEGKIYVRVSGEGEPLLLLHGNGEDSTIFQEVLSYFEQHFTVYAMDTRGHGLSELAVERLTFQRIAEDILFLLDQQKMEQIPIIGYSDGGNIGIYVAAHYPKRVSSLIALGANYLPDGLTDMVYQEVLDTAVAIEKMTDSMEKRQKRCVHQLMLEELNLTRENLTSMKVPVLLMAGEFDVVKRNHTEEMAGLISDAELIFVPEGGHDFFVDQPQSLTEAAMLFYKKIKNSENSP